MSDSLRDRIAALLELLRPVTPTEAADAVIRELGLRREKNLPLGDERCWICVAHSRRFHQPMHRHVTEWTTDE